MPDDEMRCPNCGAHNKPGARFCGQCGQPLDQPEPAAAAVGAAASSLGGEIAAITDPLLRLADVGPGVLLTATLERVLAEAGPRQAEVLRRCAIPRWFDAEVLAVLRERPDGNERVLELLRDYSFVRQVAPGRFAYDEAVRAALLREWRDARPDELRAWRRRVGPGPLADGIAALVAEEPVKRYVGRFPRSQLPYLQILSLIAFPLALLLLALFSPTQVVQRSPGRSRWKRSTARCGCWPCWRCSCRSICWRTRLSPWRSCSSRRGACWSASSRTISSRRRMGSRAMTTAGAATRRSPGRTCAVW
jgi:hypothetical protein